MTGLVILFSILAGIIYTAATGTVYLTPFLTVYVAAFIAGLATAVIFSLLSRDRRSITAALVLIANFAGSHLAWATGDPTLITALVDLLTCSYFVVRGQTRWELVLGFLFLASMVVGILTYFDVIPDATERAGGFIAVAHPDILAILGNLASAILGLGAGDSGKRARSGIALRPRLFDLRSRTAGALYSLRSGRRG